MAARLDLVEAQADLVEVRAAVGPHRLGDGARDVQQRVAGQVAHLHKAHQAAGPGDLGADHRQVDVGNQHADVGDGALVGDGVAHGGQELLGIVALDDVGQPIAQGHLGNLLTGHMLFILSLVFSRSRILGRLGVLGSLLGSQVVLQISNLTFEITDGLFVLGLLGGEGVDLLFHGGALLIVLHLFDGLRQLGLTGLELLILQAQRVQGLALVVDLLFQQQGLKCHYSAPPISLFFACSFQTASRRLSSSARSLVLAERLVSS